VEQEVEAERRRLADATRAQRKAARGLQECCLRAEEGRKAGERMVEVVSRLQGQVGSYKKQIEEAEEISSINLCECWVQGRKGVATAQASSGGPRASWWAWRTGRG
jgi:hypothetical protein